MLVVLPILWLVLLSGCPGAAADHERLGDRAYREERYEDALAEYLAAQRSNARSRVWAKAGAAALKAHKLAAAVDAYGRLAANDPTRVVEAATGLERVARQAERGGPADAPNLARAIVSLKTIAPRRPLGRLALSPAASSDPLGLLPSALASARSARATDSPLLVYADAPRGTTPREA